MFLAILLYFTICWWRCDNRHRKEVLLWFRVLFWFVIARIPRKPAVASSDAILSHVSLVQMYNSEADGNSKNIGQVFATTTKQFSPLLMWRRLQQVLASRLFLTVLSNCGITDRLIVHCAIGLLRKCHITFNWSNWMFENGVTIHCNLELMHGKKFEITGCRENALFLGFCNINKRILLHPC